MRITKTMKLRVGGVAALAGAATLISACGGSGGSSANASAPPESAYGPAQSTSSAAEYASASGAEATSASRRVTVGVKHQGSLGAILDAGGKKLTVYMFAADHGSKSTCTGACASAWPPVTTTGTPKVGGGAHKSDLGLTKRANGVKQVTYKGHPLYYYAGDKTSSSAAGQALDAFGAPWYVLSPSGSIIREGGA